MQLPLRFLLAVPAAIAPRLAAQALPHTTAERSDYAATSTNRSEEHTSELQSQSNLVCRLLLAQKEATPDFPSPEDLVRRSVHEHAHQTARSLPFSFVLLVIWAEAAPRTQPPAPTAVPRLAQQL